jgi:hypothetical protein
MVKWLIASDGGDIGIVSGIYGKPKSIARALKRRVDDAVIVEPTFYRSKLTRGLHLKFASSLAVGNVADRQDNTLASWD